MHKPFLIYMESVVKRSHYLRNSLIPNIENILNQLINQDQDLDLAIEQEEAALRFLKQKTLESPDHSFSSLLDSENPTKKLKDHERLSMELSKALQLYQTRLGLFIEKLPNSLRINFSYITHSNTPHHSLTLSHDDLSDTYTVLSCTPVPPALPLLIEHLHRTNDLPRFLKGLRASFISLY